MTADFASVRPVALRVVTGVAFDGAHYFAFLQVLLNDDPIMTQVMEEHPYATEEEASLAAQAIQAVDRQILADFAEVLGVNLLGPDINLN